MKISQLGKKLKWAFMCACAHTPHYAHGCTQYGVIINFH